jgi:hypothetical protein
VVALGPNVPTYSYPKRPKRITRRRDTNCEPEWIAWIKFHALKEKTPPCLAHWLRRRDVQTNPVLQALVSRCSDVDRT